MTGHGLDTWTRHYVGRFGSEARAEGLASGSWTQASGRARPRSTDVPMTFPPFARLGWNRPEDESPAQTGLSFHGAPRFELGTSSPQTYPSVWRRMSPRGAKWHGY